MANQFRDYCITYNNPKETDEEFFEYLKNFEHIKYFVFQREIGEQNQTIHIQAYIEFTLGKRFETVKKLLPTAHIERRRGSKSQARDYCKKDETQFSKWIEYGEFVEVGERSDLNDIVELAKNGATDYEIMQLYPTQYLRYYQAILRVRQTSIENQYKGVFRTLDVTYLYGEPGVGKSRYVMEKYGYENVYRLTNYRHGCFDGYQGQKIIVFEEFRSSFKLENMLNFLDGYPMLLPCRYNDKMACYTTVYIISNLEFNQQYPEIQKDFPTSWKAFCRRVHHIKKMQSDGNLLDESLLGKLTPLPEYAQGKIPF